MNTASTMTLTVGVQEYFLASLHQEKYHNWTEWMDRADDIEIDDDLAEYVVYDAPSVIKYQFSL